MFPLESASLYVVLGEYDRLWNVLRKLKDTGIYRYITGNPEDLQKNVNLHSLDISLYREVWSLGKELIRDIVNSYTSHQCLAFDENLNFVSESNASYLIQIIFDDLAIACRNSELRKCKFRKCNKYFLAKKGRKKCIVRNLVQIKKKNIRIVGNVNKKLWEKSSQNIVVTFLYF